MKKLKVPQRYIVFHVIHFDGDEYLVDVVDDELVMTTNFVKAKQYQTVQEAETQARSISSMYDPADIGEIIAIYQISLGYQNLLLTSLRRIKCIPF